jgi:hypothetical protein
VAPILVALRSGPFCLWDGKYYAFCDASSCILVEFFKRGFKRAEMCSAGLLSPADHGPRRIRYPVSLNIIGLHQMRHREFKARENAKRICFVDTAIAAPRSLAFMYAAAGIKSRAKCQIRNCSVDGIYAHSKCFRKQRRSCL